MQNTIGMCIVCKIDPIFHRKQETFDKCSLVLRLNQSTLTTSAVIECVCVYLYPHKSEKMQILMADEGCSNNVPLVSGVHVCCVYII